MGGASLGQGNPPRDIEHRSKYSILPKVRLHPVADVSLDLWDFSLHGPQALALNQAAPPTQVRPFYSPCICTTAQAARRAEPVTFGCYPARRSWTFFATGKSQAPRATACLPPFIGVNGGSFTMLAMTCDLPPPPSEEIVCIRRQALVFPRRTRDKTMLLGAEAPARGSMWPLSGHIFMFIGDQ
jgi:hypothetical protein